MCFIRMHCALQANFITNIVEVGRIMAAIDKFAMHGMVVVDKYTGNKW